MKFSLRPGELNNWKAGITQRVAEKYIEEILSAKLQKEGFDLSILMKNDPYHFCELMGYSLLSGRFITVKPPRIEELEHTCPISKYTSYLKRVFLNDGVFPSSDLIKKSIRLNSLQEVSTDGRLFKLKKTGKFVTEKKAFRGMNREYSIVRQGKESILPERIPLVDGEIDVIEVKSGKAELNRNQVKNYSKLIEEGYSLRYLHVEIISFRKNLFEVNEKLITSSDEITYRMHLDNE